MSESAGKPRKKKGCLFWALIILAGLVGVSALSSLAGGGGEGETASSPPAESATATSDEGDGGSQGGEQAVADESPTAATIGKGARDGKFEFTVRSVKCGKKSVGASFMEEEAQGEFCLAEMKIENIGDEAQMLDASNQKARDSAGKTYSADGSASMSIEDNKTFLEDINPGNSVVGTVVFDVPKGTKVTELELHDSAFSGGVKVALK